MGLRKDFLVHKRKTVESFKFVREDISHLNLSIESMKNTLLSFGARISAVENGLTNVSKAVDKNMAEIGIQQNHSLNVQAKIENISQSISKSIESISTLNRGINNMLLKQQALSKKISSHDASIKKLFALSKSQSLREKQLNSFLRKSQQEVKKLSKAIGKPARATKMKAMPRKITKKAKKVPQKIVTETTKKTITQVKK